MELKDALLSRRSTRRFLLTKIKDEDIEEILHAAASGPSAMNKTPWEFYVITNEEKLTEIRSVSQYSGYEAPLAIVVAADLKRTLSGDKELFWVEDCSAATENILLRATDLGLGSVWCGVYPMADAVINLQKALNLPTSIVPLNIIYIGYPNIKNDPRDQYNKNYIHYIK